MSDDPHKYELECMRLASDLTQLASEVHHRALDAGFLASDLHGRALEIHLLKMAQLWTARALQSPDGPAGKVIN
jgi:hypothetical protein